MAAAYYAILPLVAAHFALFKALRTMPYLELHQYIAGNERLPYQLRALTGWIAIPIRDLLLFFPISNGPPKLNSAVALSFLVVDFLAICVAILATRSTLIWLTGNEKFSLIASMCVPFMGLFNYLLLANSWSLSYPYDLPQLAIFALGLRAIVLQTRFWMVVWFTLGCLNRDTAIFLLAIWALFEFGPRLGESARSASGRIAAIRSVLHPVATNIAFTTLLIAIWLTSRFLLLHLYQGNPVEAGEFAVGGLFSTQHAVRNLRDMANPVYWPSLASNFAFLWVILILGWRNLRHKGLRWSLLVLPPWAVLMTTVGVLTEMRVFGELIALMAVVIGVIWWNWMHSVVGEPTLQTETSDDRHPAPSQAEPRRRAEDSGRRTHQGGRDGRAAERRDHR